jgi:hypothetical protein
MYSKRILSLLQGTKGDLSQNAVTTVSYNCLALIETQANLAMEYRLLCKAIICHAAKLR